MIKYLFVFINLLTLPLFAQSDTLELGSEIKDVTVYREGAQIKRTKTIKEKLGSHILIFNNLPFNINEENLQIGCNKLKHIQSIKHEKIYGTALKKTKLIRECDIKIKEIHHKNKLVNVELKILQMEEKLLMDNNHFNSSTKSISLTDLKQTVEYYKTKLTSIKQKILELELKKENYIREIKDLNKIIQAEKNRMNVNSSRLIVAVNNSSLETTKYELSYFMNNASWYPDYNFRIKDVNSPLNIDFKANVFQSTGENWDKVNLTLSTTTPQLNPEQEKLNIWKVEDVRPEKIKSKPIVTYSSTSGSSIRGTITETNTGETIPMANVVVKAGQTIVQGGATDFDGNYVISPLSPGTYTIEVSFIGFTTKIISDVVISPSKATQLNVKLSESADLLEAVLLEEDRFCEPIIDPFKSGTTISREKISGNYSSGGGNYYNNTYSKSKKERKTKIRSVINNLIDEVKQNITHQEYKIKVPFTILKDGKESEILINTTEVDAKYAHQSLPKLSRDVYLQAQIEQWQDLKLIEGKVSIFLAGQYIGQTYIETDKLSDTLNLQLGIDEQIQVERTLDKTIGGKTFVGNKVKETLAFNIKLKNNKDQKINIVLEDQIPVTDRKDITIEVLELNGAKLNTKTGKLTWELNLNPGEQKNINFSFFARYPKEYAY